MQVELSETIEAVAVLPAVTANSIVLSLTESEVKRLQMRRSMSGIAVFAGGILWFLLLANLHATTEGLPWYITSALISIVCAVIVARPPASRFYFRTDRQSQPLSLMETWSLAYLCAAMALYGWGVAHILMPPPKEPKLVQIVDIQLVSCKDFSDRKSPMPGTKLQEKLHKRKSDSLTSQGSLSPAKAAAPASKNVPGNKQAPDKAKPLSASGARQPEQVAKALPTTTPPIASAKSEHQTAVTPEESNNLFVKPMPRLVTPQSGRPQKAGVSGSPIRQPLFEEVQPPEMVEMIENDGATEATAIFQAGGSSSGGTGAANALSTYIKELHRRIKQGWAPPRGQSRQAQILFRVKKDGKLSFLKVVATSGDAETDEAAMKAVMGAVKTHALPAGYSLPYLDVQYTFNYTADEIKEIGANSH